MLLTPVFLCGEFHGLFSPWGCKESDMTERLSLHFNAHHVCVCGYVCGEGGECVCGWESAALHSMWDLSSPTRD